MTDVSEVIARVHREEWARVVATLARRFGDLDIAEEMTAEAFAAAVQRWPADGVPPSPGAWLTTTANNRAIDRIRREAKREEKHKEALMLSDDPEPLGVIDDDRLPALPDFMADRAFNLQLATRLQTKVDFVKHAAGDPAVLSHAGDCGEPHPGCTAHNVKDRGHRFYAVHALNIGLKILRHLLLWLNNY